MSWSKDCIISEIFDIPELDVNPVVVPPIVHAPATLAVSALAQINSTKSYFPVATLSIHDDKTKQRFKKKISWKKYRSAITTQTRSNNAGYMIDPSFRSINRLFVQPPNINPNNNDDFPERNTFGKHYMSLVEIKDFNVLIKNEQLFDPFTKNVQ